MEKVSLYIPKGKHSDVIGKGGSTIKELTALGCTVDVPKREDASDVVVISGSTASCQKARARIDQVLGFPSSVVPLVKATFTVQESQVGRLVGSGGATLREIQSSCGVYLEIPRGSPVAVLYGAANGIQAASQKIEGILKQKIALQFDGVGASAGAGGGERPQLDMNSIPVPKKNLSQASDEVLFFPDPSDQTFKQFMSYIEGAQKSIDVCVFTISDDRIANYLIAAAKVIKIRVITDLGTSANKGSDIERMAKSGIDVRVNKSGLMHNKYAVLDGVCVLNGSFNWTSTAAHENVENVTVMTGDAFVRSFGAHFNRLWASDAVQVYRPGLAASVSREIEFN